MPAPDAAVKAPSRGRGRPGRKAGGASHAELMEPLTDLCRLLVGLLSALIAIAILAPDMTYADQVAMTEQEADAVASPMARMLARSNLIKRYSASIVNGSDGIQLATALSSYGLRIAPLIAARMGSRYGNQPAPVSPATPGTYTGNPATGPGGAASPADLPRPAQPVANSHQPGAALHFPAHLIAR